MTYSKTLKQLNKEIYILEGNKRDSVNILVDMLMLQKKIQRLLDKPLITPKPR